MASLAYPRRTGKERKRELQERIGESLDVLARAVIEAGTMLADAE